MKPIDSLLLCSTSLLAVATAKAQWQQQTPAAAPSARIAPAAAFDGSRVLLFGGLPSFGQPLADTWSHDGTTWTALAPAQSPPRRGQAAMVYDQLRGVVVLYGGGNTSFFGGPSIDETWEFDGATWSQIVTAHSPGGLAQFGMSYDAARGRVVVHGGVPDSFFPIASNGTWEYDGIDWAPVATAASPGPLERPAMCWHPGMQKTLLFGGIDPQTGGTDTLWAFDGANWTAVPVAGSRPAPRSGARMVWLQQSGVCLLTGGADPMTGAALQDSWEFDGTAWRQLAGAQPGGRIDFALVADGSGRAVLFGGMVGFNAVADTWRYGSSFATFGAGCAGSNGVPALSSTGLPRLGAAFGLRVDNLVAAAPFALAVLGFDNGSWQGGALPADLSSFGMPGCTALVRPSVTALVPAAGGSAVHSIAFPNDANLIGAVLHGQFLSLDAAANAAGLTASNGGTMLVGR